MFRKYYAFLVLRPLIHGFCRACHTPYVSGDHDIHHVPISDNLNCYRAFTFGSATQKLRGFSLSETGLCVHIIWSRLKPGDLQKTLIRRLGPVLKSVTLLRL